VRKLEGETEGRIPSPFFSSLQPSFLPKGFP
jgi:hypothetical protein